MSSVVFMLLRGASPAEPMEGRDRLIRVAFSSIVDLGRNLADFCRWLASAAAGTGGKLFG
jgi:hypothetical protein